jgi:hypothetical protein
VVDHLLEGIGNRQRGAGGDQQRDPGQQKLAAVGGEEGQQAAQGGQAALGANVGSIGGIGGCLRL